MSAGNLLPLFELDCGVEQTRGCRRPLMPGLMPIAISVFMGDDCRPQVGKSPQHGALPSCALIQSSFAATLKRRRHGWYR